MDQVANMCTFYEHSYVEAIPHFHRKFYREWNTVQFTGFTSFFLHPNRSMRERCTSHVNNCDRNRKWIPLEYQLLSWLHWDSSAMKVCNGILISMSQLLSCLQSELPMGDIHYGIYPIIVNPVVFIVAVVTGMLHHHNKSCALNLWSNIIRVQV